VTVQPTRSGSITRSLLTSVPSVEQPISSLRPRQCTVLDRGLTGARISKLACFVNRSRVLELSPCSHDRLYPCGRATQSIDRLIALRVTFEDEVAQRRHDGC
jgi:hypothetical protein